MMLEAIFTAGVEEVEVSGLTQWDRGQKINIEVDEGLPSLFQVHFTYQGCKTALIVTVADTTEVEIPNELLTQPLDLLAYVYLITEDSGETVKIVRMPVVPRAKPEDYTELPASVQERVEAMVATINDKADYAVETAEHAKDVAENSVAVSAQSAVDAAASAAAAQKAAEETKAAAEMTEEEVAALMGDIDCGNFTDPD